VEVTPIPAAGSRPITLADADEDERLAVLARTDLRFFGDLYQRHYATVFRYLRSRGTDEDQAADLTAVTFECALTAIERYRPKGAGFRAWLLRIARNAALDAARSRRSYERFDPLDETSHPVAGDSPEGAALAAEERRDLERLLARLPDLHRDALVLRYVNGLTSAEIGVVIGKREAATKKLLSRALATLKEFDHVR
jgi:RNA polymerase sigma factor (sigma-70 family)